MQEGSVCKMELSHSDHLKTYESHEDEKAYKCLVCNEEICCKIHLQQHEKSAHQGVKPYKCLVCEKSFSRSCDLKYHERLHPALKPYECSVCKKTYSNSDDLKNHESVHQGVKTYKCSVCNKEFLLPYNLKIHEKFHKTADSSEGNKKAYSSEGNKRAYSSEGFRKFCEKSNQQGLKGNFQCPMCPKKFMFNTHLVSHKKTEHQESKNYKCSFCDKAFHLEETCKRHEREYHKSVKRYKCSLCNKEFSRPCRLRAHEKIHQDMNLLEEDEWNTPEISYRAKKRNTGGDGSDNDDKFSGYRSTVTSNRENNYNDNIRNFNSDQVLNPIEEIFIKNEEISIKTEIMDENECVDFQANNDSGVFGDIVIKKEGIVKEEILDETEYAPDSSCQAMEHNTGGESVNDNRSDERYFRDSRGNDDEYFGYPSTVMTNQENNYNENIGDMKNFDNDHVLNPIVQIHELPYNRDLHDRTLLGINVSKDSTLYSEKENGTIEEAEHGSKTTNCIRSEKQRIHQNVKPY